MTEQIKYSDNHTSKYEKHKQNETNIFDGFKINILDQYYKKEDSIFRKKIDFLNMRFYIETEKCLRSQKDEQLCKDQLLVILFKQITLYLDEIERLNILLKEKQEIQSSTKEKIEYQHKFREFKREMKLWECKFNNLNDSYLKMKKEYENLKMQNEFHSEPTKLEIEETNDKERDNSNKKQENLSKASIMPLSSAYETNTLSDLIKDTNETTPENKNTSSFTNFVQKNRKKSDNNCRERINKEKNEKLLNKESIEVNNININLNLHLKNNNQTNINLNNHANSEIDNRKRDIAKSYNTVGNKKIGQQNVNKSPKKANQEKQEINQKSKPKIFKAQNILQERKSVVNSNLNSVAIILNKNIDISDKKIKKSSFLHESGSPIKSPILICQNNEESKLNFRTTENIPVDISSIKNIISAYFHKYEDEIHELNQLEKLILNLTKETNIKENIRELRMSKQDISKKYSYSDGENKYSKKNIIIDCNSSNINQHFKRKKSNSSGSNLLQNYKINKMNLPSVTIDLTNNSYEYSKTPIKENKKKSNSNKSDYHSTNQFKK